MCKWNYGLTNSIWMQQFCYWQTSRQNRGSAGGYFLAGRSMHWIPVSFLPCTRQNSNTFHVVMISFGIYICIYIYMYLCIQESIVKSIFHSVPLSYQVHVFWEKEIILSKYFNIIKIHVLMEVWMANPSLLFSTSIPPRQCEMHAFWPPSPRKLLSFPIIEKDPKSRQAWMSLLRLKDHDPLGHHRVTTYYQSGITQ